MTPIRETIARALCLPNDTGEWREIQQANSVLRALDAAGLAVVPVAPTEAMVDAATRRPSSDAINLGLYVSVYRAMVAAAERP